MNIFTKLLLLLAMVATVPLAVTTIVLLVQSAELEQELVSASAEAGEQSAQTSADALTAQAKNARRTIVNEKASQLKAYFDDIRRAVQLEASIVRQCLFVDPPPISAPPAYPAEDLARWIHPYRKPVDRATTGRDTRYAMEIPAGEEGWTENPDYDHVFATRTHAKAPYGGYYVARGVDADSASMKALIRRLRGLGYFFVHNQRRLPWCISTYMGHRDGLILGYPGRSNYPDSYDPRKRTWYRDASKAGHLVWTDLYLDRDGETLVYTCAAPIYDDSGELISVAAIDVKLSQIVANIMDLGEVQASDALLAEGLSDDSRIIVSGKYGEGGGRAWNLKVKLEKVSEFQGGEYTGLFATIRRELESGSGAGLVLTDDSIFAYAPIEIYEGDVQKTGAEFTSEETGRTRTWYYLVKTDIRAIIEPVEKIRAAHKKSSDSVAWTIHRKTRSMAWGIAVISGLVVLAALVAALFVTRLATRPLEQMSDVARAVGEGNLDLTVQVRSKDEIGDLGNAINEMIKGLRERDFIKDTFKHFVSAAVVDQILRDPDKLKLGGEKRTLTVFFSDLAGFTPIAEKLDPQVLVTLINEYLGAMTDAILDEGGTLDKYVGDAIVAFWGAPLDDHEHALRACRAALANREGLKLLWPGWKERGLPLLDLRIGIHTGPMVVGMIGSANRRDYTVIGDAVNLGSRLEGANKVYGTRIMISEATREAAGDALLTRKLDLLAVVGRVEGVVVYQLLGMKGEVPDRQLQGFARYEEGFGAYQKQEWDQAENAFRQAIEILEGDAPADEMLRRIADYRAHPPPPDWNGVHRLTSKG